MFSLWFILVLWVSNHCCSPARQKNQAESKSTDAFFILDTLKLKPEKKKSTYPFLVLIQTNQGLFQKPDRMNPIITPTKNMFYAQRLSQKNMAVYYSRHELAWDSERFFRNWNELENYEILVKNRTVWILSLSSDDIACYIRDLQVEPGFQGRGIGSITINYAVSRARTYGSRLLRLCAFVDNPAVALYERVGFCIVKADKNTLYMERNIYQKLF